MNQVSTLPKKIACFGYVLSYSGNTALKMPNATKVIYKILKFGCYIMRRLVAFGSMFTCNLTVYKY